VGSGRGARDRAVLHALFRSSSAPACADVTDDRAFTDGDAVLARILLFTLNGASRRSFARRRTLQSDLCSLLLCRALRRATYGDAEDSGFRRHGFAKVARICALQAVPTASRISAGRHENGGRGKASRRVVRSVHGDDARRMGNAGRLRYGYADRLVSEWPPQP